MVSWVTTVSAKLLCSIASPQERSTAFRKTSKYFTFSMVRAAASSALLLFHSSEPFLTRLPQ